MVTETSIVPQYLLSTALNFLGVEPVTTGLGKVELELLIGLC